MTADRTERDRLEGHAKSGYRLEFRAWSGYRPNDGEGIRRVGALRKA